MEVDEAVAQVQQRGFCPLPRLTLPGSRGVRTAATAGFSLGSSGTLDRYLRRIRWPTGAAALRAAAEARPKATLLELLQCHLLAVPFENLDQHEHEAAAGQPHVPRHNVWGKTRVGVERSVEKIVDYRRGGFCFEGNLAFCWLLRELYPPSDVRLSLAQAFNPSKPSLWNTPSHVTLLVRLRGEEEEVLVDPFWGDTPRALLPLRPGAVSTCGASAPPPSTN